MHSVNISIENYLVLLLHKLIGIGNNIFNHSKDTVNKDIECLDPKDIAMWCKGGMNEQNIEVNVLERDERRRKDR